MRTYRELFVLAEFRVLFVVRSLIVCSASVSSLALGTLAYAETGSPVLSAFVMFEIAAAGLIVCGIRDHPPRASGRAVARSRAANRLLLGSPVLRPVYLALWVPNGLVVGCESLLALPWLGFLLQPGLVVGCLLVAVASVGYCAALPLQERLVQRAAYDLCGTP